MLLLFLLNNSAQIHSFLRRTKIMHIPVEVPACWRSIIRHSIACLFTLELTLGWHLYVNVWLTVPHKILFYFYSICILIPTRVPLCIKHIQVKKIAIHLDKHVTTFHCLLFVLSFICKKWEKKQEQKEINRDEPLASLWSSSSLLYEDTLTLASLWSSSSLLYEVTLTPASLWSSPSTVWRYTINPGLSLVLTVYCMRIH